MKQLLNRLHRFLAYQLQRGRAFRPRYYLPDVLHDHPDWWPRHTHWPIRPMGPMQTTLNLRPIYRWPEWIPEEWGICEVYVEHTPARRHLKSYAYWLQPEVPSW